MGTGVVTVKMGILNSLLRSKTLLTLGPLRSDLGGFPKFLSPYAHAISDRDNGTRGKRPPEQGIDAGAEKSDQGTTRPVSIGLNAKCLP
jgi:hypothetical protein